MRGIEFVSERIKAVKLREQGFSIVEIEKKLHINRSTISPWIRGVELSPRQKERLLNNQKEGARKARLKAAVWHNKQKSIRVEAARVSALKLLESINTDDKNVLELALAMLYWGEGFKNDGNPGMGNTDPIILKFFIHALRFAYGISKESLTAQLHLRADQNEGKEIEYWSKILCIPRSNFKWTHFDKRTIGRKTYKNYHGVCTIYCHNVAIQRKLINISKYFAEEVLKRV